MSQEGVCDDIGAKPNTILTPAQTSLQLKRRGMFEAVHNSWAASTKPQATTDPTRKAATPPRQATSVLAAVPAAHTLQTVILELKGAAR